MYKLSAQTSRSFRGSPHEQHPYTRMHVLKVQRSDARLQCCDRECLHDLPCRFCLDHDDFSEHFALPCLCCWLRADLQASQTWDGEHTSLLHFLRCDTSKFVKAFGRNSLLHLACSRQSFCDASLGHGPDGCLCFHWCHGDQHTTTADNHTL